MPTIRNSRQRDAVLTELCSRYDHPTAEQLYFNLKEKNPSLSLATVYRNLRVLEESGCIIRIPCEEADRYDANKMPHYHLTCVRCSRIIDIKIKNHEIINSLPVDFSGTVITHSLMYFGICDECLKQQEQDS